MPSLNRIVMQQTSKEWLTALPLSEMDAAEISGKNGRRYAFRSYSRFRYPKHDICDAPFMDDEGRILTFDIVLANQVWEHLDRPYAATRHVREMLRPGGYFWLAVPFFVPYHGAPMDCSRWTARGLRNLLVEVGFEARKVRAAQWGNRAAARRNLEDSWPPEYDPERDDLTNDPDCPICAWALAQK
ncbi:methyltransferase domain-containing protein [Roseovarius sp. SCSIO 43702]|uniref:class I SAM-dependent methyltransferase n=1 Tax=Roseovarius sp. SCSIO 43702 TaxID=2823043 RepID=UPI001C732F9C|nr:class I SAM-dependent methyltransferase [Roseovarius sp. SCSIO 43702]QYX56343.1 methyltransferase domain-containing protein [Roseovarius sp. SCSIO 43702]